MNILTVQFLSKNLSLHIQIAKITAIITPIKDMFYTTPLHKFEEQIVHFCTPNV